MCESNAFFRKDGDEELLMESVAKVIPVDQGKYQLRGLLGDSLEVEGQLTEIDLMGHKIVFSHSN